MKTPTNIRELIESHDVRGIYDGRTAIRMFCEEIEARAEVKMMVTGKLEGSHYAAMREIRKELGI